MIAPEMPSEPGTTSTSRIDIVPVQEAFSLFTRRSPTTDRPRIQAKSVNRQLEDKTRALAGWEHHQPRHGSPEFVIDEDHQLWRIEKSFRMSKHGLQARPIYHHIRESIEAHLSIVVAALAVSPWVEHQTGWSIKKFVRTARRYRTVKIKALALRYSTPILYPTTSATRSSRSAPTV